MMAETYGVFRGCCVTLGALALPWSSIDMHCYSQLHNQFGHNLPELIVLPSILNVLRDGSTVFYRISEGLRVVLEERMVLHMHCI